jgi:hypothetical protein
MIVIYIDALVDFLQLKIETLNGLYLRLYQNDLTPGRFDPASSFDEADFDGYAPVGFSTWTDAYLNASNQGQTDHDPVVFTQTGVIVTNNIYGYYVTDPTGDIIWFAERNPAAPVAMNLAGKTYTVIPHFLEDIL